MYHVPVYQRSYTWGPKQWKDFFKQIDEIVEGEASNKFLGAIVVEKKSDPDITAPGEFWVVDGQQRLMTGYLLVVAAAVATQEMAEEYKGLARGIRMTSPSRLSLFCKRVSIYTKTFCL